MNDFDVSQPPTIESDEGYQLEVHEVAQLLGVTRTRVSQLTSNGQLSFERRRVGMRNRLFYKRSEVLQHQKGFYGRHPAGGLLHSSGAEHTSHTSARLRPGASSCFADVARSDFHETKTPALHQPVLGNFDVHELRGMLFRISEQLYSNKGQSRFQPSGSGLLQGPAGVSAAQQKQDEQTILISQTLIKELTHCVESLQQQIMQQQTLLASLLNDNLALKKELSLIQQQQSRTHAALTQRIQTALQSQQSAPTPNLQNVPTPAQDQRMTEASVLNSSAQRILKRKTVLRGLRVTAKSRVNNR
jgi:hypothetical protein